MCVVIFYQNTTMCVCILMPIAFLHFLGATTKAHKVLVLVVFYL